MKVKPRMFSRMVDEYGPNLLTLLYFFVENDAISFDDFYQWVIQQRDPLGELYDAFKTFDKDDSGYLDLEEFRSIYLVFYFNVSQLIDLWY